MFNDRLAAHGGVERLAAIGNREVGLARIGIQVFPADGDCAQDLLRHADTAMYTAKRARKMQAAAADAD